MYFNLNSVDMFFVLIRKYKLYYYNLYFKLLTRRVEFKNIVKIKFTKTNTFPSILIEDIVKQKTNWQEEKRFFLLFTISMGTFRKLTNYLGWKKKNTNYVIMLSKFLFSILNTKSYFKYILLIKNIKKSFFFMLPELQKLKFKYLYIKDRCFFTKIKVKKKTYIKRRFYRKMTYMCPIKT